MNMNRATPPFAFGTFKAADLASFPGLVVGDRVLDLRPHFGPSATTRSMVASWDATMARLGELARGDLAHAHMLGALTPLPPIQPAGQLFCAGANYRRHRTQMALSMGRDESTEDVAAAGEANGAPAAPRPADPFVFAMPSSAMSGARDDVVLLGPGVEHDWELELAIVIGKKAHNVARGAAMKYVGGYTMSNDISTRDVMFRPGSSLTDFLMSKGRPGFFPTGPYIVPQEFIDDYRSLRITLKVNDELMQDELVADIIFGVEELVAYASTIIELAPGDIVLTGSPGGNAGHHGNRWLVPGDVIEGAITGLGSMRNRCLAAAAEAETPVRSPG